MRPVKSLVLAFLILPALAFAQPATKPVAAPAKPKVVKVETAAEKVLRVRYGLKAPVAKVVVSPATQMAHVVVAPASRPVVAPVVAPASAPAVVAAPVVAKVSVAPASQPTTIAGWKKFLADNWLWILFVVVIPAVLNGLKNKTVREGIIGFFAAILDRVSVTTNKDSPGTFKVLFTASKPPVDKPKA